MTAGLLATAWRGLRRAGWGFADQALSSLTNFALGIVVARTVGADDLGAFALAFAAFLIALNGSRALTSLPLTIRHSGDVRPDWRSATSAAAGTAALVGVIGGACCLVIAAVAGGSLGQAFTALGVCLPGLLVQDIWRFAFFARGTGRDAFANDGIWALLLFPALVVLSSAGQISVFLPTIAWGLSAGVAALAGMVQARLLPRPGAALRWLRGHWDLVPRYVGEFLTMTIGDFVQPSGIGAVAGLRAVGTLRAAELLLGPFNVVFQGIQLVAIPEGVRLLHGSPTRLQRACLGLSAALGAAALAWVSLLLLLPDDLGVVILGANWAPARSVLPPMAASLVALGAMSGATIGLRAMAAVRRTFRVRLVTTSVKVTLVILAAAAGGALAAASVLAVTSWLLVGIWWWQFRAALAEFETAPPEDAQSPAAEEVPEPATGPAVRP